MIIKSKRIVLEDRVISGSLKIENGRIIQIGDYNIDNFDIDYGNNRIIPGIFDTHNHGTNGYGLRGKDDNNADKIVKGYLKSLASQGVTCIFPTTYGEMIKTYARVANQDNDGAKILGIHAEGPWLNRVGEKGIRTGWPEVSLNAAKELVDNGNGLLKLVALAPEIPNINTVIEYLKEENITIALAHSDCNYEEANKAIDKGISVATHLSNVMTGLHHRDVGGFACLIRDEVYCELICDGLHVSLPMIKLIMKMKDHNKIMIISDCSEIAGAPIGQYCRKNIDGSTMKVNITPEGFCLSDTGRLMGSSKPVIFGISNLVEKLNMPIEDVCKMTSLNPVKKYGFNERGSIALNKYADFVIIDNNYNVLETFSEGRKVFDNKNDKELFNKEYLEEISVK